MNTHLPAGPQRSNVYPELVCFEANTYTWMKPYIEAANSWAYCSTDITITRIVHGRTAVLILLVQFMDVLQY